MGLTSRNKEGTKKMKGVDVYGYIGIDVSPFEWQTYNDMS